MRELLIVMLKEEWRVHSTMFGSTGFLLFPLLLTFFAAAGALFWPLFSDGISLPTMVMFLHGSYVLAGASVGAFGLFGREVMNRRFGQASMIAYSSRSLPISERRILLAFLCKDTVYYFFFWIVPFVAGVALAAPWIGIPILSLPKLLLSLSLSFQIGLSLIFLLSTLYVHSSRLLGTVLIAGGIAVAILQRVWSGSLADLLPSLSFFTTSSPGALFFSFLIIVIASAVSIWFLKIEYPESEERYPDALEGIIAKLSWTRYAHFIAKDALDLSRSEGGIGKIIFSFLFPVLFIWIALSVLLRFMPTLDILIVFAILLGVISSTIYNWVTEFDLFTAYTFLPVEVSTVIRGKLGSYALLNLVSLVILIAAAIGTGESSLLPLALVTLASVSFYAVGVTVYLTGLSPTLLLYNAKVYLPYLALITPVILFLLFVSLLGPWYVLVGLICLPCGYYFLRKGCDRWNSWDQPQY
jgi:hypothetical protein